MEQIKSFAGTYDFLSNFFEAPLEYADQKWPSSEHAYQAMKTKNRFERELIAKLDSPGKAKRAGKKLELREDWEDVKDSIMLGILYAKFDQNPELKLKLLATGELDK